MEKHRNLDMTFWSKEYNRTQNEASDRVGDELENMMRARAARLAGALGGCASAAEKAAAELAEQARKGMLQHRDAAEVAAQDLKRRLVMDSRIYRERRTRSETQGSVGASSHEQCDECRGDSA